MVDQFSGAADAVHYFLGSHEMRNSKNRLTKNLPAFLKSNDRWNWLSLYFGCASASRVFLFAARFAHSRREAGIVRPVQGQKRFHE